MKRFRSIIAIILVALLVIGMFATIVGSITAYAESVSDMQSELDSIISKRERLEKELAKIKDNKNEAMAEKAIIDEQISALSKEQELLEEVISGLEVDLEESTEKLAIAEEEYENRRSDAKERIRAMYELGSTSYISIVLEAKSIHDFNARYEAISRITTADQETIDLLMAAKKEKEDINNKISSDLQAQKDAQAQIEAAEEELEDKRAQSDALIEKFNEQSALNQKAILDAERAEAELQEEIRQAMSSSGNQDFVGGKWLWPLSGYYTITSKFGMRTHPVTGVYKLHTGVDISGSGVYGKPILAANGGKVIKAGYNTGYGNYVVIDHGGGYSTLYAHACKLNVSKGQYVNRGDVVSYVGSTGYSTGAHLHFEIIKDGEYTNPLSYYNINFRFA